MKKIILESTIKTPKVVLDLEQRRFEFSGESRPENVLAFYDPILKWMNEFGEELKKQEDKSEPYEFNFNFEYFNSLSAKYILDLCKKIKRIQSEGNNLTVKWHYDTDDDDMLEVGNEMSKILQLPFEFIEITA